MNGNLLHCQMPNEPCMKLKDNKIQHYLFHLFVRQYLYLYMRNYVNNFSFKVNLSKTFWKLSLSIVAWVMACFNVFHLQMFDVNLKLIKSVMLPVSSSE